jgi:hypothetical protein
VGTPSVGIDMTHIRFLWLRCIFSGKFDTHETNLFEVQYVKDGRRTQNEIWIFI